MESLRCPWPSRALVLVRSRVIVSFIAGSLQPAQVLCSYSSMTYPVPLRPVRAHAKLVRHDCSVCFVASRPCTGSWFDRRNASMPSSNLISMRVQTRTLAGNTLHATRERAALRKGLPVAFPALPFRRQKSPRSSILNPHAHVSVTLAGPHLHATRGRRSSRKGLPVAFPTPLPGNEVSSICPS